MSDNDLFEQRETQLKKRIDKVYYKDKEPVYGPPKIEKNWKVYESRSIVSGRNPDVYVLRNSTGNITHLLECTPKTYCEAYNYSKDRWKFSKCRIPEDCMNCTRHCKDSSGTNEYSLYYKLDKKYIYGYLATRESILEFISKYKKVSRFVLNKENIVEWSKINDGISIKLSEEAEQELFALTRHNVNKPLELFIIYWLVLLLSVNLSGKEIWCLPLIRK